MTEQSDGHRLPAPDSAAVPGPPPSASGPEPEAAHWPRRYRVRHRTGYTYGMTVSDAYSVACLLPRTRPTQRVVERRLAVEPDPNEYDERRDVFGNHVSQVGIHRPHDSFVIEATSVVEVDRPVRPTSDLSWEEVSLLAARLSGPAAVAVGPYRALTTSTSPVDRIDLLDDLAHSVFTPGRNIVDAVEALTRTIFTDWAFDPTATDWATPIDTVLADRRGVCQDFAHLAIAAFRRIGLAASYVSGYIETEPPPGEEKSIGADASHAWCSVWIPDASTRPDIETVGDAGPDDGARQRRWFDLDPTNNQFPPNRHVSVAWGRDYTDVAPLRGVVIGPSSQQQLDVAVDVERLSWSP